MPNEVAERLKEIGGRLEKATPGPWKEYHRVSPRGAHQQWHIGNSEGLCQITMGGKQRDYEFIAHAREDIPYLLSLVAALLTENERLNRLSPFWPGSCMVCGGQPLASGRECVCGGKGTMNEELRGLRIAAMESGEECARLRTENEELKRQLADRL